MPILGGKCEKMIFEILQTGEKVRRFCAYYIIKRGNVYYAYDNYEWMMEDERDSKEKLFFNRLEFGQYMLACRKLSALVTELEKIEGIKQ